VSRPEHVVSWQVAQGCLRYAVSVTFTFIHTFNHNVHLQLEQPTL